MSSLSRFVGGVAQFWYFSPSHGRLVVRLSSTNGEVAFLVLIFCEHVTASTTWTIKDPRIVEMAPPYCEFVDGPVRIRCQEAGVFSSYAEG